MKPISIFLGIVPLFGGQVVGTLVDAPDQRAVYVVTRATSAESKALFSAKLVRMSVTKLRWYDDAAVVRIEVTSKTLADLQSDPDVALVLLDNGQAGSAEPAPPSGPVASTQPLACATASPQPIGQTLIPPPPIPQNMSVQGGGFGMGSPVIGSGMMGPAVGLVDMLAGGVAQKLLNRPPSCKVSVVKNKVSFSAGGGEGLIEVQASGSCAWQAKPSVGWITILSGSGVSGSGVISYRVGAGEGMARSASISIVATAAGSPIKGKASQVVMQSR